MAAKSRTFLALAEFHAGKTGDPPLPQPKGPNPKTASAYFRAAAEVVSSLTLAGARLEELSRGDEKRKASSQFPAHPDEEESRRHLEEWERKTGKR